jgi:hypothetical protein
VNVVGGLCLLAACMVLLILACRAAISTRMARQIDPEVAAPSRFELAAPGTQTVREEAALGG